MSNSSRAGGGASTPASASATYTSTSTPANASGSRNKSSNGKSKNGGASASNGKNNNNESSNGNGNGNADDDQPPPVVLARPFRSRKNRPCDGCRRAKTRCAITEVGTPCVECQHTRKKCTFDELPRERKRPPKRSLSPVELTIDTEQAPPYASTSKRARTSVNSGAGATSTGASGSGSHAELEQVGMQDGVGAGSSRSGVTLRRKEVSLEETRGYHVVTAVLTDDLLPVGARKAGCEGDEHIRQISVDGSKPQYVVFSKKAEKQRQREDPLISIRSALSLLQPSPSPQALLDLYIISHNAAFPILPPPNYVFVSQSRRSASSAYTPEYPYPPALMPKIYTAALNHARNGIFRNSVNSVRKIWMQQMGTHGSGLPRSSLSSISDALMDMSARAAGNAEENYLILARAIAQAQLLGLHVDPSNWGIPSWEKDCRRVLWWALRVHDGWSSFLNSRPSHIQGNNHTVALPSVATILAATQLHQVPQVVGSPVVANPNSNLSSVGTQPQAQGSDASSQGYQHHSTVQSPHPQPHPPQAQQIQQPHLSHSAVTSPNAAIGSSSTTTATATVAGGGPTSASASSSSSPITSRSSGPLPLRSPSVISSASSSSSRLIRQPNANTALYAAHSFAYLCRLAIIVSRLQTQVCTLMATREDRLGRVVEIEMEVEALLGEVREFVKSNGQGQENDKGEDKGKGDGMRMERAGTASGFPSLMTCLLGFRCMARRIAIELSIGLGSPFTPDPETLERYAQAVEYISSLDGQAFDGFWLVHVGHILSSMTSSLVRLSLVTTNSAAVAQQSPVPSPTASTHPHASQDASTRSNSGRSQQQQQQQQHALLQVTSRTNPIFLLCRLRCALQRARDVYHWDLADAALARADNVAMCLESVGEEYGHVVRALKGTLFEEGWRVYRNGGMHPQQQQQQMQERERSGGGRSGEASRWRMSDRGRGGDEGMHGSGGGSGNMEGYGAAGSAEGMNGHGMGVHNGGNGTVGVKNGDAEVMMNWNIDLNLFGMGLDWTGFEGFEGMPTVRLSPDYGSVSS